MRPCGRTALQIGSAQPPAAPSRSLRAPPRPLQGDTLRSTGRPDFGLKKKVAARGRARGRAASLAGASICAW